METVCAQAAEGVPPIVLVADSDDDAREMYATALSLNGFWVDQARTGANALVFASDLKPDVIVTDVSPGGAMDGLELVRSLWQEQRTAYIPVVAVASMTALLGESTDAFAAVLEKPVVLDALVSDVRSAVGRSSELAARAKRARDRVSELLGRSARLVEKSHRLAAEHARRPCPRRPCPRCRASLRWVERQTLDGTLYDYYAPCQNGCGLFCYDHRLAEFVPLIE